MQSEEVGFQSTFERGQRLGCSDIHRKVIPPSLGQNREQSWTSSAGVTGGGCQTSRGSGALRSGRCVGSDEQLDVSGGWSVGSVAVVWWQMPGGQLAGSCNSPGGTEPLLGRGAGSSRLWGMNGFAGCCTGRTCMSGSPLWCSRRGTACCFITTPRFLALGDEVTVASPSEMEKSEKGEVRAGKKIGSVLPGLSFRWWLSIQLCMSLRQAEIRLWDLCVRRGKGEKELGIFRIAVVRHAIHAEMTGPSVQREEEGTEDWALRDSSNKPSRTFGCPLDLSVKTILAQVTWYFKAQRLEAPKVGNKQEVEESCHASLCDDKAQSCSMNDLLVEPPLDLKDSVCEKHNRSLELFCSTDRTCVCTLCAEDDHGEHSTVTVGREWFHRRIQFQREVL